MVSRAFGSIKKLLEVMERTGIKRGVFHKGEKYPIELLEAEKYFNFNCEIRPSMTDNKGAIITIFNRGRR
jgi:16S rRNA G527 N7-methylase RsmG